MMMRLLSECQHKVVRAVVGILLVLAALVPATQIGLAQTTNSGTALTSLYVNPKRLPSIARAYLNAIGTRLQVPGQERLVLSGTYADSSGSTSAQLVWQAPGSIRLDRANKPSLPLVFNATASTFAAPNMSATDADILESLLDDTAESFLYGYQGGYAHRFLGGLFRADSDSSGDYKGPWYELTEATGHVKAQTAGIVRAKAYYFDSATKLLVKTMYVNGGTRVTTQFSNWTTRTGQSYPGKIIRTENGTTVFSFTSTAAAIAPLANDGTFLGSN